MSTPAGYATLDDDRHASLCETLDRVLNTGVVVAGDAVISVADIELIYVNLRLMLSSVETVRRHAAEAEAGRAAVAAVAAAEAAEAAGVGA